MTVKRRREATGLDEFCPGEASTGLHGHVGSIGFDAGCRLRMSQATQLVDLVSLVSRANCQLAHGKLVVAERAYMPHFMVLSIHTLG